MIIQLADFALRRLWSDGEATVARSAKKLMLLCSTTSCAHIKQSVLTINETTEMLRPTERNSDDFVAKLQWYKLAPTEIHEKNKIYLLSAFLNAPQIWRLLTMRVHRFIHLLTEIISHIKCCWFWFYTCLIVWFDGCYVTNREWYDVVSNSVDHVLLKACIARGVSDYQCRARIANRAACSQPTDTCINTTASKTAEYTHVK